LAIETSEHDFHTQDNACTNDLVVTTSIVRLPSGVDTDRAVLVQIDGVSTRLAVQPS
jgi:hypothetical protein